ncbi:hypothetical protein SPACI_052300 [Sporomusa acidovorans DSM 3132]|uniref:Uncharacterized protein n=1 Tax=Sporomusa acidovorans (strain ATCC 49682 / DSM 3132 / Mol) TaxID=1123286 RepID=A0ABZ3JAQ0_SPOA4|nr:hypothetical protein SPACI_18850 [Sporomusa acidovorans DSM 3132]SDD56179.1 hypothetical protein SAMN04488499_100248 [Sporomusa acidovorans]
MIDYLFSLCALGVLGLCFSGIVMVVYNNLFRTDRW